MTKFDQRTVPNNILEFARRISEDVNALKYREMGGGSSVSGGGSGGLTVSVASVTTSNVTGGSNVHHILNLSGLTANRDFNLPTPGGVGEVCKVTISNGNNSYALIIKENGTEVTRFFIANETIEFVSTGTGAADWQLVHDGTIACMGIMERRTAQSINSGTDTKIQTTSIVSNVGAVCDNVTNYRVTIRRGGMYTLKGYTALVGGLDDQEGTLAEIYVNGVIDRYDLNYISSPAADRQGIAEVVYERLLAVGDFVELFVFHNEGAPVNTNTSTYPQLSVIEQGKNNGADGGSPFATLVEVNLGSALVWRGKFTITDAAITTAKKVLVWLAPGPYTGKGTRADEMELTPIEIIGVVPGSGSAVVTWETKPIYADTPVLASGKLNTNARFDREYLPTRINKVRGNVKFYYQILN